MVRHRLHAALAGDVRHLDCAGRRGLSVDGLPRPHGVLGTHQFHLGVLGSFYLCGCGTNLLQFIFCTSHEVRTREIQVHQSSVQIVIAHAILVKTQSIVRHIVIIGHRKEET